MKSFKSKVAAFGAAVLAGTIALGVAAAPALAASGQITDGRIVARWEYTSTESSASSYVKDVAHYAYASQDSKYKLSNAGPDVHADVYLAGEAWNTHDYARAGYGERNERDFAQFR